MKWNETEIKSYELLQTNGWKAFEGIEREIKQTKGCWKSTVEGQVHELKERDELDSAVTVGNLLKEEDTVYRIPYTLYCILRGAEKSYVYCIDTM